MTKFFKSVSLAVAAALSLTSAALAQPGGPSDLRVAYGDLDLSQPGGAWAFKSRVNAAVDGWCAENASVFAGTRINPERACREHAAKLVAMSLPAPQRAGLRTAAAPIALAAR